MARDAQGDDDELRRRLLRVQLLGMFLSIPAMLGVVHLFGGSRGLATWQQLGEFVRGAPVQLGGGFGAMLLAALLGIPALATRCRAQPWLLAPWTVLVFALGCAFACTLNWLVLGGTDAQAYLVTPLQVLLVHGALPALLFGCLVVLLFVGLRRR
ncbi:MAG: hypothetical protein JNL12_15420 [Planctomycetes bacterium]|nr:hypothetical protein [Planctomycetota bacterium]